MKNLSITQNGWTINHLELTTAFETPTPVMAAAVCRSNVTQRVYISGHLDGSVFEWTSVVNRRPILRYKYHIDVTSIAVSANSHLLAAAASNREVFVTPVCPQRARPVAFQPHVSRVRCIAFHSSSKYLGTCGDDKTIKLWEIGSKRPSFIRTFRGHTNWVRHIEFESDCLLSCGDDRKATLWDMETGKATSSFSHSRVPLLRCCWLPDSRIAACGSDGMVYVWDSRENSLVQHYSAHSGPIRSISISSDGRTLASSSADGTVRLWDINEGRHIWTIAGDIGIVNCVCFDGSGSNDLSFISGHSNGYLAVWNLSPIQS
jgi:centriolar protein POC1